MNLAKRAEKLKISHFPSLKSYEHQFELLHALTIEKTGRLGCFTFLVFLKFFSLIKTAESPLISLFSSQLLKNAEFMTNKTFLLNLLLLLRKFSFCDKNLMDFLLKNQETLKKEEIFAKELLPELRNFVKKNVKNAEFAEFAEILREIEEKSAFFDKNCGKAITDILY